MEVNNKWQAVFNGVPLNLKHKKPIHRYTGVMFQDQLIMSRILIMYECLNTQTKFGTSFVTDGKEQVDCRLFAIDSKISRKSSKKADA